MRKVITLAFGLITFLISLNAEDRIQFDISTNDTDSIGWPPCLPVTVTNNSQDKIIIGLGVNIQREMNISGNGLEKSGITFPFGGPMSARPMEPKQVFKAYVNLLNFVKLEASRQQIFEYNTIFDIHVNGKNERFTKSGSFSFYVKIPSDSEKSVILNDLLSGYIQMPPADGADRRVIDRILSVHEQCAVPVLIKLLGVERFEPWAIQSLLDFPYSEDAVRATSAFLMRTGKDYVIRPSLDKMLSQGRIPDRKLIDLLLQSKDPSIQYCGYYYLQKLAMSLPFNKLPEGAQNPNEDIRRSAEQTLKYLDPDFGNNPKAIERKTGNGF